MASTGPDDDGSYYTAEYVAGRLEQAGACLLALPSRGCLPAGMKANWPAYANEAMEAYGYTDERPRAATPRARAITAMDEAYAWILLVDDVDVRKLLLLRALVDPISGKNRWPWRRLAKLHGLHVDTIKARHGRGIDQIASRLNIPGGVQSAAARRRRDGSGAYR